MCTVHKNRMFLDGTSKMSTVHRNRTLCRQYIRNVYCGQKQNTFQTLHQKCVQCTETEHILDGASEMCMCTQTERYPDGTSEM